MPVYNLGCAACDLHLDDVLMAYDEMKAAMCPLCGDGLVNRPGRFAFTVQGSQVKYRQKMERRFGRREKRIEKTFTKEQQDNLDSWCRRHNCRRYY